MILLIDNYDSFSYNLYQMVGEIDPEIRVIRNDEMTVDEISEMGPDRIILSPGPGRPEDAGIIIEAAKELGREIPVLGVCLGHQAVCARSPFWVSAWGTRQCARRLGQRSHMRKS